MPVVPVAKVANAFPTDEELRSNVVSEPDSSRYSESEGCPFPHGRKHLKDLHQKSTPQLQHALLLFCFYQWYTDPCYKALALAARKKGLILKKLVITLAAKFSIKETKTKS